MEITRRRLDFNNVRTKIFIGKRIELEFDRVKVICKQSLNRVANDCAISCPFSDGRENELRLEVSRAKVKLQNRSKKREIERERIMEDKRVCIFSTVNRGLARVLWSIN